MSRVKKQNPVSNRGNRILVIVALDVMVGVDFQNTRLAT